MDENNKKSLGDDDFAKPRGSLTPGASAIFTTLSRRKLIKTLAIGAGLLGGGLYYLGHPFWRKIPLANPDLRCLTPREYATFQAIARTHFPEGGSITPGADSLELATIFDLYLADEPEDAVRDVKHALLLVSLGPLIFSAKAVPFEDLSPEQQRIHWESWSDSQLLLRRQIALAFRKFLSLVFFDQPSVWPFIGYPGPMGGIP